MPLEAKHNIKEQEMHLKSTVYGHTSFVATINPFEGAMLCEHCCIMTPLIPGWPTRGHMGCTQDFPCSFEPGTERTYTILNNQKSLKTPVDTYRLLPFDACKSSGPPLKLRVSSGCVTWSQAFSEVSIKQVLLIHNPPGFDICQIFIRKTHEHRRANRKPYCQRSYAHALNLKRRNVVSSPVGCMELSSGA